MQINDSPVAEVESLEEQIGSGLRILLQRCISEAFKETAPSLYCLPENTKEETSFVLSPNDIKDSFMIWSRNKNSPVVRKLTVYYYIPATKRSTTCHKVW